MKTLYLHIGTAKTATSSIQKYCADNRELLHRYSYDFPNFPFKYSGVTENRNGHFLLYPVRKNPPSEAFTNDFFQKLSTGLDIIHKSFEQIDNIILSEEVLWLAICYSKYNPLNILKKDAEENGYSIKVIVYLRRQDNYLISRYNQLVKRQNLQQSFKQHIKFIKREHPLIIQYDKVLDKISDVIGRENIIVRRFEPSTWLNNSIYDDFMDAIGMDKNAALIIPKEIVNPSLKGNTVEIKRIINLIESMPQKEKSSLNRILKNLSFEIPDKDLYDMFSEDETKKLFEDCREGNARVANEWLNIDTPLFNEDIKNLPKWTPYNKYMPEDLLAFFEIVSKNTTGNTLTYTDSLIIQYFSAATMSLYKEYDKLSKTNDNLKEKFNHINADLNSLKNDYNAFRDKLHHPFRTIFKRIFL